MTTKELKDKLVGIYRKYVDSYTKLSDQDYKAYLQTLAPGTVTPTKYRFFIDDYRDQFSELATQYRDEATAVIDEALARIRAKKTESPSTDAVNYLALLKDKPDLSEYDIDDALSAYGDNYSAYNAIRALADEHKIRTVGQSILDKLEDELRDYVQTALNKMSVIDAENGHATEGALSMFESVTLAGLPEMVF